jgi:hypothetical protein
MHLSHVHFLGARDQIVESARRQGTRLGIDDDLLAENQQGGNGTDLELRRQGLLLYTN